MSKKKRQQTPAGPDPLDEMLSGLRGALAAGDVLRAEIETARCLAIPAELGVDADKSARIFIGMAKQGGKPEDAALLRLIMLLGSPVAKRRAREALGELTAAGAYPASWVTEAGKPDPVRAVRVYDTFGDWEQILVTFRYPAGQHTLVASVALTDLPVVRMLELIDEDPRQNTDDPFEIVEQIGLADARARLAPALFRSDASRHALGPDVKALLPIAKARLRRLPADGAASDVELSTGADRAALVREFLASSHAAEAVAADEPSTRFWAEILTAWSSRIPGHPPLQAGPLTLRQLLASRAPFTYSITPAQFQHMAPAVTAWARWSAAQRGLDEEHMVSGLPQVLDSVSAVYDEDAAAGRRAYLTDVATSDADIAELREIWDMRTLAVPVPEEREVDDGHLAALDVADPEHRAAYLAAEFGGCELDEGIDPGAFLAAVRQVSEELWHGQPASTREHARALLAADELDRHDILHELARRALTP